MDTTAQNIPQAQPAQEEPVGQPAQQQNTPQVSVVNVPQAQALAVAVPVGVSNKETGPALLPPTEVIRPTEASPIISKEVAQHGVEVPPNTEIPALTLEDKKAGFTHAKETIPATTEPVQTIHLPMTYQQATTTIKKKKVSDSIVWLAILVIKQLKKMHRKIIN